MKFLARRKTVHANYATLPTEPVWVEGVFATLHEDGSVEFYCDGDVRVSLKALKELVRRADQFSYERSNPLP